MARPSHTLSLYAWWIVLIASLFLLLLFEIVRAEEPAIPVYTPPPAATTPEEKSEALPSPLEQTKSLAPETPKQQALPQKTLSAKKKSSPKKIKVSDDALPSAPKKKFAAQINLSGGDAQVSGSTLQNIRFSKKGKTTRAVFDFDTKAIPYCTVNYAQPTGNNLTIECSGVSKVQLPTAWSKAAKAVKTIEEASAPYIAEEDQLTLDWKMARETRVDVFHLAKPGRLVVDIKQGP